VNRLQKILEDANIKLASVATDVTGVSARAILHELLRGEMDAESMAQLARGRMRKKIPELQRALEGFLKPHHRLIISQILAHIDYLDEAIAELDREIEERMRPFEADARRLDGVPGLDVKAIQGIIAEGVAHDGLPSPPPMKKLILKGKRRNPPSPRVGPSYRAREWDGREHRRNCAQHCQGRRGSRATGSGDRAMKAVVDASVIVRDVFAGQPYPPRCAGGWLE